MRRAWLVSMEYDNRNRGHTMCRTKLQATAEACRLADLYRARGHKVTLAKKPEGELFVRELEEELFVVAAENGGFTICISEVEIDQQLWDRL